MVRHSDLIGQIMYTLHSRAPAAGLTVESLITRIGSYNKNQIVYHIMLLEERGWIRMSHDLFIDTAEGRRITNGGAYVQMADRGQDQMEASESEKPTYKGYYEELEANQK